MKRILCMLVTFTIVLVLFGGCGSTHLGDEIIGSNSSGSNANTADVDFSKTDKDMFTDRDGNFQYDPSKAVTIELTGTSATASSDSVEISGSTVAIKEEATYVISGKLDGMILVDAPKNAKVQLVLCGVNIYSETSAAIYIVNGDKVFVTLAEGSVNTLANGGSFTQINANNVDAVLFSKQDLTLNGTGSLTVTSPGGHGIVCKDDLVITGGSYEVNVASHGIDANDSVRIRNAGITIDAGKDGIHCENGDDPTRGFVYVSSGTIKAEAEGDGVSASHYLQINGGTIDLVCGGGSQNGNKDHSDHFGDFGVGPAGFGGRPGKPSQNQPEDTITEDATSMKGLRADNSLLICGGDITINSADDCIHSNVSVFIQGGTFSLASGDDAIHAEDTLTVTDGNIEITESYEGLEALHIDLQGGDVSLIASDDGLNAAGGVDQSGTEGGRDGMFGGPGGGRPGGNRPGGGGVTFNSNGSIRISGGTLYIQASGDGIDANGTLEITGGHTTVVGPTRGDTAILDHDVSATISGGTFIGTGAAGMAQSFSDSKQGLIAVNVGNQSAGTEVKLQDADGNTILTVAPKLDFAVVILSSPELTKGESYTLFVGSQSAQVDAE